MCYVWRIRKQRKGTSRDSASRSVGVLTGMFREGLTEMTFGQMIGRDEGTCTDSGQEAFSRRQTVRTKALSRNMDAVFKD